MKQNYNVTGEKTSSVSDRRELKTDINLLLRRTTESDIIELPARVKRNTDKRKAVGLHSPEGSEVYAYYFDVSRVRIYRDAENQKEKQQPPLGKVTVVKHFV